MPTTLLKAESSRLNLPAFKILGASWGVYRSLCTHFSLDPTPLIPLSEIASRAQEAGITLFAATDGNHGRAVARMAALLGVKARIYAPRGMYTWTSAFIRDEGTDGSVEVVTTELDYDGAVAEAWNVCGRTEGGVMVQDNAFKGYEVVPGWISDGYGTLLGEVDDQLNTSLKTEGLDGRGKKITHVVTPIGVGSLGHAVVKWARGWHNQGSGGVKVIAVEPETAACLQVSLRAGKSVTVETEDTIMSGMCCGTVSPTAWEDLKQGVDVGVTVGDWECHEMVREVEGLGLKDGDDKGWRVEVGPCGAGCLVGLKKVLEDGEARKALELDEDSVVIVLSTEGKRDYPVPERMDGR